MNLFESVKAAVTVRQAAEHYGLEVNRGNMVCCPFHNDRIPSMKLNEDYFYCFGCGAHGDVIDLVARLFNLSSYDAAKKLAAKLEQALAELQPFADVTSKQRVKCLKARAAKYEAALKPYLPGRWASCIALQQA